MLKKISKSDQETLLKYIMGNAKQSIKKLADMITNDNDHNGVGYAIRSMIG